MRISPQTLGQHLKKGLAPFYLLYGTESFLIEESARLIRQSIAASESYQVAISLETEVEALSFRLEQPSLFAPTLLVDCKLVKTNTPIMQKFAQILQRNYANTYFIIQTGSITRHQQQASWFTFLEQRGLVITHWGLNPAQYAAWVDSRALKLGLVLDNALRQNILAKTQGNCLAGAQELENIRLLGATSSHIIEQSQYDVSDLCEAVLTKNPERIIKIMSCLKETGEALQLIIWMLTQTLGLLLRGAGGTSDITKLLQKTPIRSQLHPLYHQVLKTALPFCCATLLSCLSQADNQLKSGNITSAWQSVLNICLQMAGIKAVA